MFPTRYSAFPTIFDELIKFSTDTFKNENYPFCDVYTEGDKVVFEFALSGFKREDINITVDKKILTVSFKKEDREEDITRHYIVKNLSKRSFKKSFVLSDDIDVNSSYAKLEDGILTITFDKKQVDIKQLQIN